MSTQENGIPDNIENNLPDSVSITNVTNATPMAVTTAAPHGMTSGDRVHISGVSGNVEANGIWTVTVTGGSSYTIPGSGTGAYTSGGTSQSMAIGPTFAIPSDGDLISASSVGVPFESNADRTAFLYTQTGAYKLAGLFTATDSFGSTIGELAWATFTYLDNVTWETSTGAIWELPFDCEDNDILELKVSTTMSASVQSTVPAQVGVFYALFATTIQPGENLGTALIPGSMRLAAVPTNIEGVSTYYQPLELSTTLQISENGSSYNIWVRSRTQAAYSTLNASQTTLISGYFFEAKLWRPTVVIQ
jgi:hypothetical protein